MNAQDERSGRSLWLLIAGPGIWIAHFLLSYVTASVYCAKTAGIGLAPVRLAVGAYTALALIGLVAAGVYATRRPEPGDAATGRQSRRRFIGSATVLLCGLGGLATMYVAIVALFFEGCR